MSAPSRLPIREDTDALWQRYSALVRQCADDPTLRLNRNHQIEIVRAHKRFTDAFTSSLERP